MAKHYIDMYTSVRQKYEHYGLRSFIIPSNAEMFKWGYLIAVLAFIQQS